ncbi:ATP-binding protein [Ensifer adhaerens]|uniref:ATP-binding protein n=1 Tax=Ensifer adhaerens TaxID=106592 RepID=UPI001C4E1782|nr:ATP-binding protein [Ensifer adhaerens]MBW0366144.1 ATP-binding protein [Ensifer adhaerens]UCM19961.1 ATP-binding protein [Ensifer adhaerens]
MQGEGVDGAGNKVDSTNQALGPDAIDAMPTKAFFVDMLIRDIPLERAVLDLVDNCIDGAKRLRDPEKRDFSGLWVKITMTESRFLIEDNCGGFDTETAKNYAFRFGRPQGSKNTNYSIGQFGVGMKRALFKFGRKFTLKSATAGERWEVDEDVDVWETTTAWSFGFKQRQTGLTVPEEDRGTSVLVERIRPEVGAKFGSTFFQRTLSELIRVHQRQFISRGLEIRFNGEALSATNLELLVGNVVPAVETFTHKVEEDDTVYDVDVRIVAGVGSSNPSTAGWYVVCNGRVVLAADRSEVTGWGLATEQVVAMPKFHNQFARFRGVAYFDCTNAAHLPWNTTKTGLDADIAVWRLALQKMIIMARSVIDFLNEVDREQSEQGTDGPLQRALTAASSAQAETITSSSTFKAPDIARYVGPRQVRISYSRPAERVDHLMSAYGVSSAKAVGEKTFDLAWQDEEDSK